VPRREPRRDVKALRQGDQPFLKDLLVVAEGIKHDDDEGQQVVGREKREGDVDQELRLGPPPAAGGRERIVSGDASHALTPAWSASSGRRRQAPTPGPRPAGS